MNIRFKQLLLLPTVVGILAYGQPAVETLGAPYPLPLDGVYLAPRFSPDGDKLALTTPQYGGIYIYDLESDTLTELTSEAAAGFGLAWSPDGNWIAARTAKFENRRRYNAVVAFQVNTGERRQFTGYLPRLEGIPGWSPDGNFVFLNFSESFQLYSLNPTKKPDSGTMLLYARGKQIYQRDLLTRQDLPLLTTPGEILTTVINAPRTKVAYEILGGNLWVFDLVTSKTYDLGPGNEPCWHPDGDRLAFMVTTDDGHQITSSDIYVVNSDGSGRTNLTNSPEVLEMRPTWSPDGKMIVYDTDGTGPIMVQEVR